MSERLFDKLYNASKEVLKELAKPLAERRLKRKFQSAYDSADEQKVNAELDLQKANEDLATYEINKVLQFQEKIDYAEATKEAIKKQYKSMFNEEMIIK